MKIEGFRTECLPLKQAIRKRYSLPAELSLWGSFEAFEKLNPDKRNISAFLMFYYDELVGGIVYYEKKFFGLFSLGSSPHTNLAVPFGHFYIKKQDNVRTQEQLNRLFFRSFTDHVRKKGYIRFYFLIPPWFTDVRELTWNSWNVTPKYTYIVPIDAIRKEGIANYMGKKLRNIVKSAQKELSTCHITVPQFYACYADAYRYQKKIPPLSVQFFRSLNRLDAVEYIGAFHGATLTSAAVLLTQGDTVYYISSGNKLEHRNSNGVTLILYEQMKRAASRKKGVRYFDLVGANREKISQFKTIFKPNLQLYFFAMYKTFHI